MNPVIKHKIIQIPVAIFQEKVKLKHKVISLIIPQVVIQLIPQNINIAIINAIPYIQALFPFLLILAIYLSYEIY